MTTFRGQPYEVLIVLQRKSQERFNAFYTFYQLAITPRSDSSTGFRLFKVGLELFDLCELDKTQLKGLILAQNERWRRGLGMQVERERSFGN